MQKATGIYIHIPFCARKCGYCDFNAYSGYKSGTIRRYVDALCREIKTASDSERQITTVFFGGGTPSLLPADELIKILDTVHRHFNLSPDAEISLEANPSDAKTDYLAALRTSGFNRLSLGVQTFDDRILKTLDRLHSGNDANTAIAAAKAARFENISIDLMFALPRQTAEDFDRSLNAAFALDIPHLSIYALIVEPGTPFWARRERGKLALPGEDREAEMFAQAIGRATLAGYEHYEVSNYARPDYECRHNRIYWQNDDYFGFGAGAWGNIDGTRRRNENLPSLYIDKVMRMGSATVESESVSTETAMGETMMVGLRLREGVSQSRFQSRFGKTITEMFPDVVKKYTDLGLLEICGDFVRLTRRGLFLANDVMAAFLPD